MRILAIAHEEDEMSSVSGHSRRGLLAASAAVMAAAPAVKTQAGEKKGKGKPKPPLVVITVVIRDLMQIDRRGR